MLFFSHHNTIDNWLKLITLCTLFVSVNVCAKDITIEVRPTFGNQAIQLPDTNHITSSGDTIEVTRFRCYISNIEIIYQNDSKYVESNSYHLIDIEEPASLLIQLQNIPEGSIKEIRFAIGVDSLASVSGAMGGDLDPAKGMYWSWNSGYINAKLEGKSSSCDTRNSQFEFHIGGYQPPYATIQTVFIKLPDSGPTSNHITLAADLSYWFRELDLKKEYRVLMPGEKAVRMAERYSTMFRLFQ